MKKKLLLFFLSTLFISSSALVEAPVIHLGGFEVKIRGQEELDAFFAKIKRGKQDGAPAEDIGYYNDVKQIKRLDCDGRYVNQVNKIERLPKEIGNLTELAWLNLENNHLSTLPAEIGKLTRLCHLFLGNNQLTSIPKEIGKLTELTWLDLHNSQLTSIPVEIGKLIKLEGLCLWRNPIKYIPPEFRKWRQEFFSQFPDFVFLDSPPVPQPDKDGVVMLSQPQERIWLCDEYRKKTEFKNRIKKVQYIELLKGTAPPKNCLTGCWPTQIGTVGLENKVVKGFTSLQQVLNFQTEFELWGDKNGELEQVAVLKLKGLGLRIIPPFVFECKNLERLFLEDNEIEEVPEAIGELEKLTFINLGNNQISQLPQPLRELTELGGLILSKNNFQEVPLVLGNLRSLEVLGVEFNPLENFKTPWAHLERLPKMKRLYIADEPADFLYEQCEDDESKVRFMRLIGIEPKSRKKSRSCIIS